jgi:chemotaxis signal transduction protein
VSVPYLVVRIDGRRVALPAMQVENVLAAVAVTPPTGEKSDTRLLGAVNVRGTAVPAFDLRQSPRVHPDDHMVLVALGSGHKLLLFCDEVEGMMETEEAASAAGSGMLPQVVPAPSGGFLVEPDGLTRIFDLASLLVDGGENWRRSMQ